MSGIFGLINLDGAPVEPESLEAMRNAMAHWGPDGGGVWFDGCAGLGQSLLFNSPEAQHERLPRAVASDTAAFTAEARIDNRSELLAVLDVPSGAWPTVPDGEIVWRAYERWGQDAPSYLFGDWSFAVWHPSERRIFLARDHHGNTSLYYFHNATQFAFASDKNALLALPGAPRAINELFLAQMLIVWPAFHGHDTIFQDLQRLPPAHSLVVSAAGVRRSRYWSLENTPELRLRPAEMAEGLRHSLDEAVRCRLRTPGRVAISLSGGLDSTSIGVLAARDLERQGKDLLALTAVPAFDAQDADGRIVDEWRSAQASMIGCDNVEHVRVSADQISPIAGIRRMLAIHREPWRGGANYYWGLSILEGARRQGAGVLLTGQFGNHSISWGGVPTFGTSISLLAERRLNQATRELRAWITSTQLFAPYRRWRRWGRPLIGNTPWRPYSAINPDFARRIGLRRLIDAAGHDATFCTTPPTPLLARLRFLHPGASVVPAYWAELGAANGLEVRDPTSDARLLTFAFGVPNEGWRYFGPRGLIREAMSGILPDRVRLAKVRGRQSADLAVRLRNRREEMNLALAEVVSSDVAGSYVDIPYLQAVAREISAGTLDADPLTAGAVFLRGLTTGLFLDTGA